MPQASVAEVVEALRPRDLRARRGDKTRILDEFVALTGYTPAERRSVGSGTEGCPRRGTAERAEVAEEGSVAAGLRRGLPNRLPMSIAQAKRVWSVVTLPFARVGG